MGFTVKVSQIAAVASERDIYDFFSFSGDIAGIEISRESDKQVAFVTFQEERSVDTALLLTGAVIQDAPIIVEAAEGYVAPAAYTNNALPGTGTAPSSSADPPPLRKAEDVVASLLAAGYLLGRDAAEKASEFDKQHDLSSQAAAHAAILRERTSEVAAELDKKFSISQRLQASAVQVSEAFSTVDSQYHLTTTAKSAAAAAEAGISTAAASVLQNEYVASSKQWLWGAVGKAVGVLSEVRQQAKEKVMQADAVRGLVGGAPSRDSSPLTASAEGGGGNVAQLSAALEAEAAATTSKAVPPGSGRDGVHGSYPSGGF